MFEFDFTVGAVRELKPRIHAAADELLDGKKDEFLILTFAEVENAPAIKALPWMAQYDLSSLLVPAIDKAYSTINASAREARQESQLIFANLFVVLSAGSLAMWFLL